MGKCGRTVLLSVLGVALQLIGLVLFVLGFFPVKPALMGKSDFESAMPSCQTSTYHGEKKLSQLSYQEASGVPRQFDRLVIMIVDGMPAELVLGRGGRPPPAELVAAMPFTHSLLASRKGFGYHAKAAPPTVTMPRLKAMTSGAIAGFLDVAFNFNTQALLDDNLVDQLAIAGWKMVMLGDETWLKLFPDKFMRHDGVNSFYVKDTVEVDYNVTRHLQEELAASDWDLLVLHYLGLDHVGHLGGRSSSLVAPKLKEMDDVIQRIYEKLIRSSVDRRTLLMVASDHGMTDGGNHGGASYQEADALALFISGSYPGDKGELESASKRWTDAATSSAWPSFQVDVVPTLAQQLGVPIPKNSVGALLPQLFTSLAPKEQLRALELNAWQLFQLVRVRSPGSVCVKQLCSNPSGGVNSGSNSEASGRWSAEKEKEVENFCELFKQATDLHFAWILMDKNNLTRFTEFEAARDAYLELLKHTSEWLARGTTEKNTLLLVCGGVLMLLSPLLLIWTTLSLYKAKSRRKQLKIKGSKFNILGDISFEKLIAVGGVCIHAGSLASSSFVEEEQYTYHFLVATLSIVFIRHALQQPRIQKDTFGKFSRGGGGIAVRVLAVAVILLCGRLLRAWHRSGVNWAHLPDIAKWLETVDVQVPITIRYAALLFATTSSCLLILSPSRRHFLRKLIACCLCLSATLIFVYVDSQSEQVPTLFGSASYPDQVPTLLARSVFGILGITAVLAVTLLPWIEPLWWNGDKKAACFPSQEIKRTWEGFPLETGVSSTLQSVGRVLISCWCLLQVLLQQSINAGPVGLLLVQLLATVVFFRHESNNYELWFQVLALQWMGGSGHFGLGNSNTLATVDVAGAYIGLSSHSTALSGLLAFIITYASPFLFLIGMMLLSSPPPTDTNSNRTTRDLILSEAWLLEILVVPCILPVALNGVILVAFTAVLTLMQDHLFVWSVFSPKYLYVCAATVCTSVGALLYAIISAYCTSIITLRLRQLERKQLEFQSGEKKS
ncbi:hypothetical protein KC19_1G289300 [Ceratodon purpureus]|uniref:GPI ethanolamine phosphate transferase 2 C-terminal domain-containing protein n=1 Tax=Ceratodon purpureus TaxID=3225 RepID=A0A8T0JAI1_CERPU|nr:hypothetical protein KC19_1G289300 [Ceratodon purpureus]